MIALFEGVVNSIVNHNIVGCTRLLIYDKCKRLHVGYQMKAVFVRNNIKLRITLLQVMTVFVDGIV